MAFSSFQLRLVLTLEKSAILRQRQNGLFITLLDLWETMTVQEHYIDLECVQGTFIWGKLSSSNPDFHSKWNVFYKKKKNQNVFPFYFSQHVWHLILKHNSQTKWLQLKAVNSVTFIDLKKNMKVKKYL